MKPIVLIGNAGLTDGVVKETLRALEDHELIKIRVQGAERGTRDEMLAALLAQTESTLVQRIGHVAVLYKPRKQPPRMVLPD